jgi:O-antigen/teichoic acid export membrane protein
VVQIISLPIFLHSWGAKLYGEWLILAALPAYIAFSDVGFGNVAANDMTMRVAAGDREGALETFQSTWTLMTVSSLLVLASFITGACWLPLIRWLDLSSISAFENRSVLILLGSYALLSLQADLTTAGFRCQGNYAMGMLSKNLLRLAESGLVTAMVAFHARPIAAAGAYFAVRAAGTFAMGRLMRRKTPWLHYGFRHATFKCARRLAGPAVAYLAFPAGNALSLQGMVLVIGAALGPVAVVSFSTMRTLTRFGFQIMESIKNSVWPELSAAYGGENWALARRLHRAACQVALWSSLATVIFLYFCGSRILSVWTHGRVVANLAAFHWLLVVIVANSFWYTSSVVTIASNTHQRVAAFYLLGTTSSLGLAHFLMPYFGMSGAAMSLLAIDLIVGWYVLTQSLASLREEAGDFCGSMFRLPQLGFRR